MFIILDYVGNTEADAAKFDIRFKKVEGQEAENEYHVFGPLPNVCRFIEEAYGQDAEDTQYWLRRVYRNPHLSGCHQVDDVELWDKIKDKSYNDMAKAYGVTTATKLTQAASNRLWCEPDMKRYAQHLTLVDAFENCTSYYAVAKALNKSPTKFKDYCNRRGLIY